MTHVGYIVAGYAITFGGIAVYAGWVLARSRSLARLLPSPGGRQPEAEPDASRSVGPLGADASRSVGPLGPDASRSVGPLGPTRPPR